MGEEGTHRDDGSYTQREGRDDVILSVFPRGGSTAC